MSIALTTRNQILSRLKNKGPASIALLMRELQRSRPTIYLVLAKLCADNLVHAKQRETRSGTESVYHLGAEPAPVTPPQKWTPNLARDPFALPAGFFGRAV